MKLMNRVKKSLVIAMAVSSAAVSVYATPVTPLTAMTEATEVVAPTITGMSDIVVKEGGGFGGLRGVKATDKDGNDVTRSIKVSGSFRLDLAGLYELTYTATDSNGVSTSVGRNLVVLPKNKVEPTILGLTDLVITTDGGFGALRGVMAFDKDGNNITNKISAGGDFNVDVPGVYEIVYKVTDQNGVTETATRKLTVLGEEGIAPTFTGLDNIVIKAGEGLSLLRNVTATDKDGNDITSKIKVGGEFDLRVAGTYTLTYEVTDQYGITRMAERSLTVLPQ